MEPFTKMLSEIARRPAMYVGKESVQSVSCYVNGYCHALDDLTNTRSPLDGWMRWVEMRFLICHPAWGWPRILVHAYGSDRAAFDALPSLFAEFLVQRDSLGVDGIQAETERRLLAEYGKTWHAPETTITHDPT